MTNKIKVIRKTGSLSYDSLDSVVQLAGRIIENEKDNGGPKTLMDFSFDYENDYDNTYTVLEYQTLETDEEYNERIRKEKYWDQVREAKDREDFERLKKKFGN